MKNIIAPNSRMVSASAVMANCGQFKPEKRVGWETRRTVPGEVLAQRLLDEHRENLAAVRNSFRAPSVKLGIFCKRVKGGQYQILNHGIDNGTDSPTPRIVASFADVKEYAKSIGRAFVQMGAVKTSV